MRYLSYIVILFLFYSHSYCQSPHGDKMEIDCEKCHSSESWKVDLSNIKFKHSETAFELTGAHAFVKCGVCHDGVKFSANKNKLQCASCHKDIHENSVGKNCARCHNTKSWIIENITSLHRMTRFPLVGSHINTDCRACHKSASELKFEQLGINCYDCHSASFISASNPNHVQNNFSRDCLQCHNLSNSGWATQIVNHSFFPLTGGHSLPTCASCHKSGGYKGLSIECYSCHQDNYNSAPDHKSKSYPTNCKACHNITTWQNASFNHASVGFLLDGGHLNVQCASCHKSGIQTSKDCFTCHSTNFQSTSNPNHTSLSIPNTCELCHTTQPGWKPAKFTLHSGYYLLAGAHLTLSCASCHNGNYNVKLQTVCSGCHTNDFNSVTNPNHVTGKFPSDCTLCHTQTAWKPSTFSHDTPYFPIYSGTHAGRWSSCSDCHTNSSNYAVFSCITCHTHSQTNVDPHHTDVRNYVYSATSCYSCHKTGRAD